MKKSHLFGIALAVFLIAADAHSCGRKRFGDHQNCLPQAVSQPQWQLPAAVVFYQEPNRIIYTMPPIRASPNVQQYRPYYCPGGRCPSN